jgi:propionyl-CoA carboxylase alpha chain
MFDKILIANRGEIACRVIRTANKMGIATVAVYSQADKDALHVELADEAVPIGPPAASDSYLVIDKIVDACRRTGAQAVQPGYGFLSERADFADALRAHDIAFIGPHAGAIRAMGDKIESKKLANDAKVSTVPGHLGTIESAAEAVRIAGEIGYPVMIKASAGGGGKGMRIACSDDQTREGYDRSKSEAASAFGDDRIFIEKFIENPRHVEIQVLADKHGKVIHLGERECSIQRRNQKVIEEAPSPLLDADARRAMGQQAVALARAVDYDSAGTVEFVAGQDGKFFFLEMNTRLQVEHPVTEMITGIDLVEQMIRIAGGEKLALTQDDVMLNGWAVEARIYAEDPYRNFLPSIGRLVHYRAPPTGTHNGVTVRNDTGVVEGAEISMYYDPMIGKLVTHAATRAAAIDAMSDALDACIIDGIQHNVPFLSAVMSHQRWKSGDLSTGFIAEEFPNGFAPIAADAEAKTVLASVATAIELIRKQRLDNLPGRLRPHSGQLQRDWVVKLAGEQIPVKIVAGGVAGSTDIELVFDGRPQSVRVSSDWSPGDLSWRGQVDGRQVTVQVRSVLNGLSLSWRGVSERVACRSPAIAALDELMPEKVPPDTSAMLLCPMPGLVVSINVTEGQEVKAGDTLAVVEAMKMENVLRAERDATIRAIKAAAGDSLAVDAVIMEFE